MGVGGGQRVGRGRGGGGEGGGGGGGKRERGCEWRRAKRGMAARARPGLPPSICRLRKGGFWARGGGRGRKGRPAEGKGARANRDSYCAPHLPLEDEQSLHSPFTPLFKTHSHPIHTCHLKMSSASTAGDLKA